MPPTNPLENAIRSAARANETLAAMFRRAGSVESGRGYVISAYRTANRALAQALQESNRTLAVWDTIRTLKASLRNGIRTSMLDASAAGVEEALRQLRFYEGEDQTVIPIVLGTQVDSAVTALMAQVERQEQLLNAYLAAGLDETLITGDAERQGVLRPSDILTGAAFWMAALMWGGYQSQVESRPQYDKQAVATLDARVTECCLKVHGQIQELDDKFHLTGSPRFADHLDWTPFHWYCRTSIALYLPEYDDGLTARMRSGANYFLSERAAGRWPDQHPANAFIE